MPTLSANPRAHKSRSAAAPRCPKCGTVLTVVRDDQTLTTLVCAKCAKAQLAEWLATPAALKTIRKLARSLTGLALVGVDDLTSEVVLAILESENPPCPCTPAFDPWLADLAKRTASRMRNGELETVKPGGEAVEYAADPDADPTDAEFHEPQFNCAADMKAHYDRAVDARRKRVARALAKLPPAQRRAIKLKFFSKANLAEVARQDGRCDSAERMNLCRAKKKLISLVTADGYAVLAA